MILRESSESRWIYFIVRKATSALETRVYQVYKLIPCFSFRRKNPENHFGIYLSIPFVIFMKAKLKFYAFETLLKTLVERVT